MTSLKAATTCGIHWRLEPGRRQHSGHPGYCTWGMRCCGLNGYLGMFVEKLKLYANTAMCRVQSVLAVDLIIQQSSCCAGQKK